MKSKKILALLFAMLLVLTLSACDMLSGAEGDDSLSPLDAEPEATVEPVISELDKKIMEYEQLVSDGSGTAENYLALADLYKEAGRIKDRRNMLERCYRLFNDETAFETLQGIVVNAKEDSKSIYDEAVSLQNNMSVETYNKEAVAVLGGEWFNIMMPKLGEGRRNYYLEEEQYTFYCEVGYSGTGIPYTKAWYLTANNSIVYLSYEKGVVQLITSGYENGNYNGGFTSWICSSAGLVYNETGTFSNGILVGDYTVNYSAFEEEIPDLFTMFSTKDILEYTSYKGNFGDNGISAMEQPAKDKHSVVSGGDGTEQYVVYAYTEDGNNYLFINIAEDAAAEAYVFDTTFLNISVLPEFERYIPIDAESLIIPGEPVDPSKVEIRIIDSYVEWFDGTSWHILGDVEDYIRKDPFYAYNANSPSGTEGEEGEEGEEITRGILDQKGLGTVKKEVKKPTKPKATPKPATGGSTAPAPPPPAPTPAPPEDTIGGETDIEWSGDVL